MRSRIALSTSLLKRIVCALPGVDRGKVVLDLGRFGAASLMVDQLHIGQDVVQLPLRFHLRGDPAIGGVEVTLSLTNWQVRDDTLWFTLERVGILRGPLFRAAQSAMQKIVNGAIQRHPGDRVHLEWRDGQLGISIKSFLSKWGDPHLPIEVAGIEVDDGLTLYLR